MIYNQLTNQRASPHSCPQDLSARQSVRLTEALAGCPRVLLSKLRELASLGLGAGLPSDPLAQVGGLRGFGWCYCDCDSCGILYSSGVRMVSTNPPPSISQPLTSYQPTNRPPKKVRLPGRCLEVLRLLLDALSRAAALGSKPLRCELYAALLQYLHFCRGARLGDAPPLVLERLLEGLGPGVTAGQLDVLQVRGLAVVVWGLCRGICWGRCLFVYPT